MTTECILQLKRLDNDCTCNDLKEQKQQDGIDGEPCPVHGECGGEGQGQQATPGEGQSRRGKVKVKGITRDRFRVKVKVVGQYRVKVNSGPVSTRRRSEQARAGW